MASTSLSARYAKWLSIPLGLVISALLIWQASYAAFSDTITTQGSWTAGTVTISNGPEHLASFEAKDLTPGGAPQTATMHATYTGSLPAKVSFYGANYYSPTGLAEYIDLTITAVPFGPGAEGAGVAEVFNGSLQEFALLDSFENGRQSPGDMAVPENYGATLNIEYALRADAPDGVQGAVASIDFIGEARSIPSGG